MVHYGKNEGKPSCTIILLQLAKPSSILPASVAVGYSKSKTPRRNGSPRCHHVGRSNPTRTRTPLRWCEKIPSWLSHELLAVDLWIVVCDKCVPKLRGCILYILLQEVEEIIEYTVAWDIWWMKWWDGQTHTHTHNIHTHTRGNILKIFESLPTGLLQTFTS